MATYLIKCVNMEHSHSHIVSATVQRYRNGKYEDRQTMSITTIRRKLEDGDTFETYSQSERKFTDVDPDTCRFPRCTVETIRSRADAVTDNNLDNIPC